MGTSRAGTLQNLRVIHVNVNPYTIKKGIRVAKYFLPTINYTWKSRQMMHMNDFKKHVFHHRKKQQN